MDKRRLLQSQADRIELVLRNHKAPARVTGGRMTPRTIQFELQPAPTTKVAKVESLNEEIAMALGVPSARVNRSRGRLTVEVEREDCGQVRFLPLARQLLADDQLHSQLRVPGTALLGLDLQGIPLLIRLSSPDVAHVLIAGTTGSGKTEVARTVLASLVFFQREREIQVIVVDPKGSAFRMLEGLPHLLAAPIRTIEQTLARLSWLEEEMERRQALEISRPRIVLVLDELADLLMQGGREMQGRLTRLAQRGRSAGISILALTQKPSAAMIGSLAKANFPVRLVGRVTSADDARVAAGIGGTGAEKLGGRGEFVLVAAGEQLRFQAAFLAPEDYDRFRQQVRTHSALAPRSNRRGLLGRLTARPDREEG